MEIEKLTLADITESEYEMMKSFDYDKELQEEQYNQEKDGEINDNNI